MSAITAAERTVAQFSIGRVLSVIFRLFFTRFHRYALPAILLNLPDLVVNFYFQPAMFAMVQNNRIAPDRLGSYFALLGGSLAVTIVVTTFGQAVLIYRAWGELRGDPVGLGTMMTRGLARWPVAVLFTLLLYALICVGALFLVFPAIIFMTMAFVGLPACVIERGGPFHGLTRSIDLTEGHRWRVFVLLLLLLVLTIGGALGTQALLGRATTAFVIVQFVWQSLAVAFSALVGAVTYLDLRIAKEGGEIGRLASVFD